ncbi:hypothetical protein VTN02DRAFT_2374 [Thermoascus thermophilus]
MPEAEPASVIPAQLSFLAIYNPLLGTTDETLEEQIVFYSSKATRSRRTRSTDAESAASEVKDDRNAKLRQIGLAQGMVSFAKNFSGGKAVDYVETEKSRAVLHELEKNWWILASVDLTRLPSSPVPSNASAAPRFDYSSREVCPPQLLVQQIRRAHSVFLLHHDATLDDLYKRVGRSTFCSFLDRFWTDFIWSWDILLHGNPAVDIFNGIKLAAGGELGIGVGEEEWGSGEREVLEDFVYRTDGLVDLVVSRFGDAPAQGETPASPSTPSHSDTPFEERPWLGSDIFPRPSDGVIFTGVGAISRSSLAQVSSWMEWIYRHGEAAYGVGENPTSIRRRKQRKRRDKALTRTATLQSEAGIKSPKSPKPSFSPGIPPPLVTATPQPPQTSQVKERPRASSDSIHDRGDNSDGSSVFGTETLLKYLTLGYASSWGFSSTTPAAHPRVSELRQDGLQAEAGRNVNSPAGIPVATSEGSAGKRGKPGDDTTGKFIIGLRDDPENEDTDDEDMERTESSRDRGETGSSSNRMMLRTLHLRMASTHDEDAESNEYKQVQAVVYVRRPFMFTFLFELDTPALANPSFYRSIHHQLGPLQKPLLSSTSPANVSQRISMSDVAASSRRKASTATQPIYDLVYDPSNLTVRSSIPNIPEPGTFAAAEPTLSQDPNVPPWSRVEALTVHHRLLSTYIETRSRPLEMERTCKTSRGWWVVWLRLPNGSGSSPNDNDNAAPNEAFLIRKASDYASSASNHYRSASGSTFFRDLSGASLPLGLWGSNMMGPRRLVEGVGIDPRRYIEGLLSLNR